MPAPLAPGARRRCGRLLITGGHDHETSFYSLFDGYKDLPRVPVADSATAFQNDLRGKYDVVIMYDFSRDLDEKGKKNLRDFVESGKGIVVLHHACSTTRSGPGGIEDVVGGSYRLAREGDIPSSTVKNDQDDCRHARRAAPDHRGDRAVSDRGRDLQADVDLAAGSAAVDDRQPQQRPDRGLDRSCRQARGWSRSSSGTGPRCSPIRRIGPWCTTPSCGPRDGSSDGRIAGRTCLAGSRSARLFGDQERNIAMKLGLYSITYLGLWYRGRGLALADR